MNNLNTLLIIIQTIHDRNKSINIPSMPESLTRKLSLHNIGKQLQLKDIKLSGNQTLLHIIDTEEEALYLMNTVGFDDMNIKDKDNNTPLINIVEKGNNTNEQIKIINLLLSKGADIDIKNKNKDTLLHLAKTKEIAELLLQKGYELNKEFNLNDKNNLGYTPFVNAIKTNTNEQLQLFLLSKTGDITWQDNNGNNILCFISNKNVAEQLLNKNPDLINQTNKNGDNVIHINTNIEILELFLNRQNNLLKQQNNHGDTPLLYTVIEYKSKQLDYLKQKITFLLEQGANYMKENKNNEHVAKKTNEKIFQLIIDHSSKLDYLDNDNKNLLYYVPNKYLAERLLNKQNNLINQTDKNKNTVLHNIYIDYDIFNFFITKEKTLINKQNENGDTPLHLFLKSYINEKSDYKRQHIVLLLKQGADCLNENNQKESPLSLALDKFNNNKEYMKLILLNANIKPISSKFPVLLPLYAYTVPEAERLLQQDENLINHITSEGNTILHLNIDKPVGVIDLYYMKKPDLLNKLNQKGESPFYLALKQYESNNSEGNKELLLWFKTKITQLNITDKERDIVNNKFTKINGIFGTIS